jgi:predicted negative regulator of RcsB-dependent stress response
MIASAPLLLLGLAVAGGEQGVLEMPVGDDARVQLFRVIEPGLGQLMIHGCPQDLGASTEGKTTKGIIELDVTGVGERSWYMQVKLADPGRELVAVIEEGSLRLSTRPAVERSLDLSLEPVSLEQLLLGQDLPQAAAPPSLPMLFMHGEALLPAFDPREYDPLFPVYAPGVGPGSWSAIDAARETFLEDPSPRARAEAAYALGWNYLELGFSREARYYFELLPAFDHIFDPRVISMTRARVALELGQVVEARQHLEEGWRAGASPEQVLESMALLSLVTADPPPAATAHALLDSTGRPEAWLLAAELLQRANHFDLSIEVLQGLDSRVPEELEPAVFLRLGDALMVTGDHKGAMRAYKRAPEPYQQLRLLHAQLLSLPSPAWAEVIPYLRDIAKSDGLEAAEALYLLAQVNIFFGERTSAMKDLQELEERFPEVFARSDAGHRQLDLYFSALEGLHEQLRWVDIAALHRQIWSRALLNRTTDHRPLLYAADAFDEIGLPEEARRVLGDAFYVLSTQEGDDPVLVFRLAELYAQAGRNPEALETLEYLSRHDLPSEYRGRRALLRAEILAATGDDEGALAAYMQAARSSDTRDEAQIQLALRDAEAGRCKQAIPSLQRLLMPSRKLQRLSDPLPFLALARCLMVEGREAEAAQVAREAAGRIERPEDARQATYIGSSPADEGSPASELSRSALMAQKDIWALLGQEDLEAASFDAEVDERRSE